MEKENVIIDLTFKFSLEIMSYCHELELQKKYVIANQLLKSGTSIGANVREAQGAESKSDFKHKIKIAYKEAEETKYWLQLCQESNNYPSTKSLLQESEVILKVLGKILKTLTL